MSLSPRIKIAEDFKDLEHYSGPDCDNIIVVDKGPEDWYLWVYKRLPEDKCSTNLGKEILVDDVYNRWRLGMRLKYSNEEIREIHIDTRTKMLNLVEKMEEIYQSSPDNGYNVVRPESFGEILPYKDCSDVIEKMLKMTAFIDPLIVLLDGRYVIDNEINLPLYGNKEITFISIIHPDNPESVWSLHNSLMNSPKDGIEEMVNNTKPLIHIGENANIKVSNNDYECNIHFRNVLIKVCNKKGNRIDDISRFSSLPSSPVHVSHMNTLVLIDPPLQ